MNVKYVFKITSELSETEQVQFRELFSQIFNKSISASEFDRKYICTPLGYSYHGLMFSNDKLVGTYNIIPYWYDYFGTRTLFGLSTDTMIAEKHRAGPFNVFEMARLVYNKLKQNNIGFVFGFPNDNAYQFTKRILKWNDIGELDFYVLPINFGALRPEIGWVNSIARLCVESFARIPKIQRIGLNNFKVKKVNDERFEEHRYDGKYQVIDLSHGGKCIYRIHIEKGNIRTLYIIDVLPLIFDVFSEAIRKVRSIAVKHADLILYVGKLPFNPAGLIHVPRSKQPRRVMMCGKVLDFQSVDERVLQIENWNVNISNFDVR